MGLIVLPGGKRPLIMVTKTSGSYSHSNRNISFPRAEFINYAFLIQDLYFLRQELECMLNFLIGIRAASPTTSPLQLLPRQLTGKRCVAGGILTHIHSHTPVTAPCSRLRVPACAFTVCVFTPCVVNYSQTRRATLCFFAVVPIQPGLISLLPYYCKSEVNDYS